MATGEDEANRGGTVKRFPGASIYFPGPKPVWPAETRVLVVEKTLVARNQVRDSLMRSGIPAASIALAEDIKTALFVYHLFRPTIVIVDAEMPTARGTNVARELLAEDPSLQFVVLSGLGRIHPRLHAWQFNRMFTVVERPAKDEALARSVRDSIHRRWQAREHTRKKAAEREQVAGLAVEVRAAAASHGGEEGLAAVATGQ
jgi:DNA-binding NtrC family response regulator